MKAAGLHSDHATASSPSQRSVRADVEAPRARSTGQLATILTAFLATACGNAPSTPEGTVERDSAGIIIVENDHTRPAWRNDGWRIGDRPLVQIGAVEAEGPEQLYGVTHSGLLPNGDILIVNSRAQEVRIFDGRGHYRHTIGRRGEGPGEFRSPWMAWPIAGDSMLVIDLYRAVSIFDSAGNHARRFVPGDLGGEMQGAPIGQFDDGTLFFQRYQRQNPAWTGVRRSQVELVRFDLNGAIATNFGLFDDQTGQYGPGPQLLFGPRSMYAAAANSIIYGPGDRFELREIGMEGRTTRLIRLDLPLRPITEADRDEFKEVLLERVRGTRGEALTERRYADATSPEHFPAHYEILVDDRDHMWVQDYRPYHFRGPRTWYVFDPGGAWLGDVTMPARFTVHEIAGARVIGRWTDEFDVEYVRVYEIENR